MEKSVVEKCCREVLEKSLVRGMLGRSVGKECWREECCREVL